jgi:hypothetical protein
LWALVGRMGSAEFLWRSPLLEVLRQATTGDYNSRMSVIRVQIEYPNGERRFCFADRPTRLATTPKTRPRPRKG